MTIWRMSFREGSGGHEMWEDCVAAGVAAITYYPLWDVNLSQYSPDSPPEDWSQLKPAQKYAIKAVAYEMKKGDTVYAKQGPDIVGKATVLSPYEFNLQTSVIDTQETPWAHQVRVDWATSFVPVRTKLGDQPMYTVRPVSNDDVRSLTAKLSNTRKALDERAEYEGKQYRREATFRCRNQSLIEAKKAISDFRCEVCEFNFRETYGNIGDRHIVAHHIEPIGGRPTATKTTLNDLALVCDNCHAMLHTKDPPLTVAELRQRVDRRSRTR